MPERIDLTGERFGRLVALRPSHADKRGEWLWLCRCDCGNEVIVRGAHLRSSATRSCGCLRAELSSGKRWSDVMREKRRKTFDQKRESLFWSRVAKRSDAECWLWTGGHGSRYPTFCGIGAHRYSYKLHHGSIPPGMIVMHTCDTPFCVNPDHLRLGTLRDNRADCVQKNRHAKGSTQGHSRFTEKDIHTIRARRREGECLVKIAADYDTYASVISGIANHVSWRHI